MIDAEALSFDCYGTLIDWETGIWEATATWRARTGVRVGREPLLEAFGALESEVERTSPSTRYPDILAGVLRRLGERFGAAVSDEEAADFGASVPGWPAFPDSGEALRRLASHYRLFVLSNIDRASFEASRQRLGIEFEEVLTAEDIGAYKPDLRGFRALLELVEGRGIPAARLVHVAQSRFHDHVPARAVGLRTVWIDRRHDRPGSGATPAPAEDVRPDHVFHSMAAFAEAAVPQG